MRVLIFAGEFPTYKQHVQSVLAECKKQDVEYVYYIAKETPTPGTFAPRNPLLHRMRDFFWDRFSWTPNRFRSEKFDWENAASSNGEYYCKAIKAKLPWKPDVVVVVTPHEGHAKYQLIPWANQKKIPVLSIDHGMPTVAWYWGAYRDSMMGCTANAVWSDICKQVNVEYGAPSDRQVITGSPSIDTINDVKSRSEFCTEHGLDESRKIVLMLGTHRHDVKAPSDEIFQRVIDNYSTNDKFQLIYKPHPVELSSGKSLNVPPQVRLFTSQSAYLGLVNCADVVVSPASSVIVPAMAFRKAFVNTITMANEGASKESLARLLDYLGTAVFPPEQLDDVIHGRVEVDARACDDTFGKFGYKRDGGNGARVLSLAEHLAGGGQPNGWIDGN